MRVAIVTSAAAAAVQVSDREYLSMYPSWAKLVEPAQQMMAAGKGEEVLCRCV